MTDNILRLILPSLKSQRSNYSADCGKNDAELIIPLAILLMKDSNDFFLVLALLYIIL